MEDRRASRKRNFATVHGATGVYPKGLPLFPSYWSSSLSYRHSLHAPPGLASFENKWAQGGSTIYFGRTEKRRAGLHPHETVSFRVENNSVLGVEIGERGCEVERERERRGGGGKTR